MGCCEEFDWHCPHAVPGLGFNSKSLLMFSVYYEEVERYCPSPSFHRPLLLVGPALLHLDRLTDQVYDSDSDVFAQPILCEFLTKNMFLFVQMIVIYVIDTAKGCTLWLKIMGWVLVM